MAGLRRRLLLVVLPVAASFAVMAAAAWFLCPCAEGQPAGPDGDAGPLPGSCTPVSRGTARAVAAAVGLVLGAASYYVYDRFADGDDEKEAARAKKAGYDAVGGDDAEAGGGKN